MTETTTSPHGASDGDALDERPWLKYQPGDRSDSGDIIDDIFQRSFQCCVFLNFSGNLQWEYHSSCVDGDASSAVAMRLIAQVNSSVFRERSRRRVFGILADALANALDARVPNETRDFFEFARVAVEAARTEALHITYLVASTIAASVIVVALLPSALLRLREPYRLFAICAALACMGALLSVWLRFTKIPIQMFTSHLYTAVGGVSRVVFGAFFGCIFLLFQKAGVLLTVIRGDYAIGAAALVAGFSERMIPELLAAFESEIKQKHGVSDASTEKPPMPSAT